MNPFPFATGAYSDDSRPFSQQDCVGMLPVNAEQGGTRSPALLRGCPGLREFSDGTGSRQRGAHVVEGRLYVVIDDTLYQQHPSGGRSALGTIPGTGRVSMAHNQIAGGNELLIANGSSGYVWNTVASTLTRITDSAFPGAIRIVFIAQMFVGIEPQRRYAFNSQLADGLNYDGTETFQGESKPDRLVSIAESNGELVLLSEQTIEHFDHTGVVNALFQNKKITLNRGCASTHAVDSLDGALFLIGEDGSAYAKRGYQLQRISTHAIEQAWSRCDLSKAFSFTWEDGGHKVWYVTFPDGYTWGYDCATQKWHRRQSYGMDRWRLAWLVKWRGEWYGGEYNSGRIFVLDWDYAKEGDDPLIRRWRSGKLHRNNAMFRLNTVKITPDAFGAASVYAAGASLLLSGDLPDGDVNDAVDYDYTATGTGPFEWEILGTLPDGITHLDGTLSGTFTAAGSFSWTVQVTDANGVTATLVDHCTVTLLELEITGSLPDSFNDVAYESRLGIVGGTAPYSNPVILSGTGPTDIDLTIDGDEIVVTWPSGSAADTYTFEVQVDDSLGLQATSEQEVELFQTYEVFIGHNPTSAQAVSNLDPDTNTITATFGGGDGLRYPCITDDGLYVVGASDNGPAKIEIATGTATAFAAGALSHYVTVDATHAYALKFTPSALYKLLIADGSLVATYTPSTECAGKMAWNSDRSKLYLSRYTQGGFTTLTIATGTLTNYAPLSTNAGRGVAVRHSDDHVFKVGLTYLVHYNAAGTVLATINTGDVLQNPEVHPNGFELWVPNYDDPTGLVYRYDITGTTPVLLGTISVGSRPNSVAFSPDGLFAYVTNSSSDTVSVIDTTTYAVTSVPVNDEPHGAVVLAS